MEVIMEHPTAELQQQQQQPNHPMHQMPVVIINGNGHGHSNNKKDDDDDAAATDDVLSTPTAVRTKVRLVSLLFSLHFGYIVLYNWHSPPPFCYPPPLLFSLRVAKKKEKIPGCLIMNVWPKTSHCVSRHLQKREIQLTDWLLAFAAQVTQLRNTIRAKVRFDSHLPACVYREAPFFFLFPRQPESDYKSRSLHACSTCDAISWVSFVHRVSSLLSLPCPAPLCSVGRVSVKKRRQ